MRIWGMAPRTQRSYLSSDYRPDLDHPQKEVAKGSNMTEFDYIVVGAGVAGSVFVARHANGQLMPLTF